MVRARVDLVYFVLCVAKNQVKIGITNQHPDLRFKSLRTGSAFPLEPLAYMRGGKEEEAQLHQRFCHLRETGEWFRYEDEIKEFIECETFAWRLGASLPVVSDPTDAEAEDEDDAYWESRLGRVLWDAVAKDEANYFHGS